MELQVPLGFLFAICINCVIAYAAYESDAVGRDQCERMFPLMPWRRSYRLKCTYLCKGWPFRNGNEPDGIPCGAFQPLAGRTRVCMNGRCVSAFDAKRIRIQRKYRMTRTTPTFEEGGPSHEFTEHKEHFTTYFPEAAEITSRKRDTTSKTAFETTMPRAIEASAATATPVIATRPATKTASTTESSFRTPSEVSPANTNRPDLKDITPTDSSTSELKTTTLSYEITEADTETTGQTTAFRDIHTSAEHTFYTPEDETDWVTVA